MERTIRKIEGRKISQISRPSIVMKLAKKRMTVVVERPTETYMGIETKAGYLKIRLGRDSLKSE